MFTSAGWKRQHGDKDMLSNWKSPPRPGAKSSEQGRPYNRRNREVGRRREGGGWGRSSGETDDSAGCTSSILDTRRDHINSGSLLIAPARRPPQLATSQTKPRMSPIVKGFG